MQPPELIEPTVATVGSDHSPPRDLVSGTHYRQNSRAASHLVVHRLDSKDRRPELWEEAYEARVSLLAQEAAEVERENEHLRTRLALADDELELRRKLCRCRRWTK